MIDEIGTLFYVVRNDHRDSDAIKLINRCTYVRMYVTQYPDICSLVFSETLQLDRALRV